MAITFQTKIERKIARIQKLAHELDREIVEHYLGPVGGLPPDRMRRVQKRLDDVSASCEHALANLDGGL